MLTGCIYLITNKITKKQYVGKTVRNPLSYWIWHKHNAEIGIKKYLYDSMRKHGIENFDFVVIYNIECKNKIELNNKLCELERYYICLHNTKTPNGYNLTDG